MKATDKYPVCAALCVLYYLYKYLPLASCGLCRGTQKLTLPKVLASFLRSYLGCDKWAGHPSALHTRERECFDLPVVFSINSHLQQKKTFCLSRNK